MLCWSHYSFAATSVHTSVDVCIKHHECGLLSPHSLTSALLMDQKMLKLPPKVPKAEGGCLLRACKVNPHNVRLHAYVILASPVDADHANQSYYMSAYCIIVTTEHQTYRPLGLSIFL